MEHYEYPAGAVVFMPGDLSKKAYLIHSGAVELRRGTFDSNDREAQLGPGEVFGELSLLTETPHTVSARVIKPARLSAITRDEFEQALSSVPTEVNAYIHSILERLKDLTSREQCLTTAIRPVEALTATLYPLTRTAASSLPHASLPITNFPFRIGRSSSQRDRRQSDGNDLFLEDRQPYNVSRNHAMIDMENGKIVVRDMGSSLGILVNDTVIGGPSDEQEKVLDFGDNIIVLGGMTSPFQFRVSVRHG
ncbi:MULTISPECIES: cyclic nucleotide-binding domain-containing protein [unclassified Schlesneria]|uniref:cyclic nucleotide-binding domain-containing protein n=1 Tax=Schlesneria TaxID=656899 RepID=UPI002EF23366